MKEKLEKRIRELVPELMELSFGCYVRKNGDDFVINRKMTPFGKPEESFYKGKDVRTGKNVIAIYDEIIGHPIHLEHVLKAIKKVQENNIGFFINQYGICYSMIDEVKTKTCMSPVVLKYENLGFNLSKPFTDQNEELYQFLGEILLSK